MKNQFILLLVLSCFYLLLPIIKQMITIDPETKYALIINPIPETNEAESENQEDIDMEDLDTIFVKTVVFYSDKCNFITNSDRTYSFLWRGKLESPPPQS